MTYVEKEILTTPHLFSTYRSVWIKGYFYSVHIHLIQKEGKTIYLMQRAEQVKDQPLPYFNTIHHPDQEFATFAELEADVRKNNYPGVDLDAHDWIVVTDFEYDLPIYANWP